MFIALSFTVESLAIQVTGINISAQVLLTLKATDKNPNGKLRLLYEAAPMSFLMEQAGGMSITGRHRIMVLFSGCLLELLTVCKCRIFNLKTCIRWVVTNF